MLMHRREIMDTLTIALLVLAVAFCAVPLYTILKRAKDSVHK